MKAQPVLSGGGGHPSGGGGEVAKVWHRLDRRITALEATLAALTSPYLSVRQAAAYLGVSPATAKYYVGRLRLFPIYKVGRGPNGRIRLRRSDLDLYLTEHRREAFIPVTPTRITDRLRALGGHRSHLKGRRHGSD